MATVILKWNPNFSSFSMFRYLHGIVMLNHYETPDYNWSVWDYDKIHIGDRFYFVKLGHGATGIVGCGEVTSEPYMGEDWSGRGRKTHYIDFRPDLFVNPDALPILTCTMLTARIPDFVWNHGHSGLVLTDGQAATLDRLWAAFTQEHREVYAGKARHAGSENDYIFWEQYQNV